MNTPSLAASFDLASYRWWTIAKTEADAIVVIRQTRARNEVLRFPLDRGLPVI